MKKLNAVTLAGFALCGFLLGMKALGLAEAGITLLLMVWGGYAYGAAAARAPLVLYAVLGTAAALGLTLYELHRENQQYKRRRCISRRSTPSSPPTTERRVDHG